MDTNESSANSGQILVESTGDDSEIFASVEFSKGLIPYLWI